MLPYREHTEEQLEEVPLLAFINHRSSPGEMAAQHWHPSAELLFVFGGEARQHLNGESFSLHPGDTLLIAPGAVHATTALEEECYIGVVAFFPPKNLSSLYLPAEESSSMPGLFSRLQEEFTFRKSGYALIAQGLLWQVLGMMERQGQPLGQKPASSEPAQRMEEYLRLNISNRLSLQSAAEYAGYSPAYFSRYFSKVMGMPFKAYTDKLKIQAARAMLADGMRISETSYALGYDTPSSFCRAFKRLTGQTPSDYQAEGQKMYDSR